MFTYIYSNKIYRFWKSGFLLDFFFKKMVYKMLFILFYTFNMLFGEKYFIEYNFLKIMFYLDFLKNSLNFMQNYFTMYFIGFLFCISIMSLFLSLNA